MIADCQAKGEIRPDLKPEFIIFMIDRLQDLLKNEQLWEIYDDPKQLALEVNRFFFNGIIGVSRETPCRRGGAA